MGYRVSGKLLVLLIAVVLVGATAAVATWLLTRPSPPDWLPSLARRVSASYGEDAPSARLWADYSRQKDPFGDPTLNRLPYRLVLVGDFKGPRRSDYPSEEAHGNTLVVYVAAKDRYVVVLKSLSGQQGEGAEEYVKEQLESLRNL